MRRQYNRARQRTSKHRSDSWQKWVRHWRLCTHAGSGGGNTILPEVLLYVAISLSWRWKSSNKKITLRNLNALIYVLCERCARNITFIARKVPRCNHTRHNVIRKVQQKLKVPYEAKEVDVSNHLQINIQKEITPTMCYREWRGGSFFTWKQYIKFQKYNINVVKANVCVKSNAKRDPQVFLCIAKWKAVHWRDQPSFTSYWCISCSRQRDILFALEG